jgi:hypothetical protein
MNLGTKLILLTALLVGIAAFGPGFCVSRAPLQQTPVAGSQPRIIQQSIIKVHTEHGVITLPGSADSWDDVENAIFVADSIADLQIANGAVPSQISYE